MYVGVVFPGSRCFGDVRRISALPCILLAGPGVGGSVAAREPGQPGSRRGHIDFWAWEGAWEGVRALEPRSRTVLSLRPIETVVRERAGPEPLPVRAFRQGAWTVTETGPGTAARSGPKNADPLVATSDAI